jgi:hypothetical protein
VVGQTLQFAIPNCLPICSHSQSGLSVPDCMAQPFYQNDLKFLRNLRGAMLWVIPAFSSEDRSPRT